MNNQKNAFTLIEMLVVIAIIALLASIITPMATGALDRAKTVRCASNLRQVGNALLSYASEHEGRYPPHTIDKDYSKSVLPGETQYWSDKYLLGQYVGSETSYGLSENSSIFRCPSAVVKTHSSGLIFNTYGMNGALYPMPTGQNFWGPGGVSYPSFPPPMLVHAQPSKTIFVIDAATNRWHPGYGTYPPAYAVTEPHSGNWSIGSPMSNFNWVRRHNRKQDANVAFLDGHVRTVRDLKYEIDERNVFIK